MKAGYSDYKRRNIAMWNEVAPRYHERFTSSRRGPFQSTNRLVELLGIKAGDHVLDVACGTGVVIKKITKRVGRTGRVIGVDTSVTAMRIAKGWNGGSSNLLFVNSDAESFYFKEKFDVITCQYGLFFFPNAAKALKNMRSSLKTSGRLGISVHGLEVPFYESIIDAVTKFIPDYASPGPSLDRYATKKALREEVRRAGFSRVSVRDFMFSYSPGNFDDYWRNYLRYVARPIREKLDRLEKSQKRELEEMVRENARPYTKRGGKIQFPWQVLILTAGH